MRGYTGLSAAPPGCLESAGSSGEASSSHWSNFEIPECSRDKGKYEYMVD